MIQQKEWFYIGYSRQTPEGVCLMDSGSTALSMHTKGPCPCVSVIELILGEH